MKKKKIKTKQETTSDFGGKMKIIKIGLIIILFLFIASLILLNILTSPAQQKQITDKKYFLQSFCGCPEGIVKLNETVYRCDETRCGGESFECWFRSCRYIVFNNNFTSNTTFLSSCCPEKDFYNDINRYELICNDNFNNEIINKCGQEALSYIRDGDGKKLIHFLNLSISDAEIAFFNNVTDKKEKICQIRNQILEKLKNSSKEVCEVLTYNIN